MTSETDHLCLRLRERVEVDAGPPLDAFLPSRYGERSTSVAYRGLRELTAPPGEVMLDGVDGTSVRVSRARRGPAIRIGADPIMPVFFASSDLEIPAIGDEPETGTVIHWNFRAEDHGYVALTSVDEDGTPRPSRGLTLFAALLPLTLAPTTAMAAPGVGGALPVLAQPASKSAKSGEAAPAAKKAPPSDEGVAPAPSAAAVDPNAGPDAATEAPRVSAPGPRQSSGSGVWAALIGSDLRLTLADGSVFEGRLLGVHGSALITARAGDDLVVAVDSAQVTQANAVTRSDAKRPRALPRAPGTGLLIGGAIMTGIAGGLLIGGIAAGAYCAADGGTYSYYGGGGDNGGCWYYWVPFVVPGVALAGGGIPMVIVGKRKRDAWKQKHGFAQLSPRVTRTRTGWTGGITLRF